MLLAVKGNRECKISPDEREDFSEKGFDIYEKLGNGKVTLIEKYSQDGKVVKELKARIVELEAQVIEPQEESQEDPKEPVKEVTKPGKGK